MAFTLLGDNKNRTFLDPQTGMPTSRPLQFHVPNTPTNPLLGATTTGTGTGTAATNGNPAAPKLDLLKVIKNPELDKAREDWLGDINSQRTQQSEFLKKLNGEVARLNTPELLGKEKSYLDLTPITNQVRQRENQFAAGIDSGLRLATDRATAASNAALLGQPNSSWAQMARGNALRDAAVPYLTQKATFGLAGDQYLQGLRSATAGRETALNQQYLQNSLLPMNALNQMNAQYGQLLGQNIGMLPGTQFLSVGGEVNTANNFTGAQPFAPYYGPGNAAVRPQGNFPTNTLTGTGPLLGAPQGVQGGGLLGGNPLMWTAAQRAAYYARPSNLTNNSARYYQDANGAVVPYPEFDRSLAPPEYGNSWDYVPSPPQYVLPPEYQSYPEPDGNFMPPSTWERYQDASPVGGY